MKKIIFVVMIVSSVSANAMAIAPHVAPAPAHVYTAPTARPVVRTYPSPRAATIEPMDSQYRAAPVIHPAPVVVPHSSCTDEKRKKKEC